MVSTKEATRVRLGVVPVNITELVAEFSKKVRASNKLPQPLTKFIEEVLDHDEVLGISLELRRKNSLLILTVGTFLDLKKLGPQSHQHTDKIRDAYRPIGALTIRGAWVELAFWNTHELSTESPMAEFFGSSKDPIQIAVIINPKD